MLVVPLIYFTRLWLPIMSTKPFEHFEALCVRLAHLDGIQRKRSGGRMELLHLPPQPAQVQKKLLGGGGERDPKE